MKVEKEQLEKLLEKLHKITAPVHAEYIQISQAIPSYVWEDEDCEWWTSTAKFYVAEIEEVLKFYKDNFGWE